MDAIETIFARHSSGAVSPDPIPREVIERLLSAAVQAPNHHRVRPWRFIVLQGKARERLGDLFASHLQSVQPDFPEAGLEKERAKPLRAPLLIAVGVDLPDAPRVELIENICAAAAAAENLLIAAQDLGLAAIWRTGDPASAPEVKAFLGLLAEQPLIGFLYIGYPIQTSLPAARQSFEDRTTWIDS